MRPRGRPQQELAALKQTWFFGKAQSSSAAAIP
jgi:hypothetical protein